MVVNRITTMGGRAGGGARSGGGGGFMAGYRSGIGSGRAYGLNESQRFVFEAMKSDMKNFGSVETGANGKLVFKVGDKSYSESGLAKQVKKDWATEKANRKVTSDKDLAKRLTHFMVDIKTGYFFRPKD